MGKWLVIASVVLVAACGVEESSSPGLRRQEPSSSASGLSQAYAENCSRCHGERGEGTDRYPKLPNGKDESTFIAIVRVGRGEMPAFGESQISVDDLRADYRWLTTPR